MRLRTRGIRCDRPTVQGSPARSPAQCPRAGCQLVLPQRTIRCDAKDHARPRKYLEQNTFSKRGVQVEPETRAAAQPRSRHASPNHPYVAGSWSRPLPHREMTTTSVKMKFELWQDSVKNVRSR